MESVQRTDVVQRASLTARQSGQAAVLLAALLPLILATIGVLVDGGRMLIEYRRAQVAIDSAAFAAAQRVDRGVFFTTQAVVLSQAEATLSGGTYGSLNSRGAVRVTSIQVSGGVVVARGYAEIESLIMGMFGKPAVHLDLVSRAAPAYGIWRESQ